MQPMSDCSVCASRGAFDEPATLWALSLLADGQPPDSGTVDQLVSSVCTSQQAATVASHPSIPPDAALRVVDKTNDPAALAAYLFRPDADLDEVLRRIRPDSSDSSDHGFSEAALVELPDRLVLPAADPADPAYRTLAAAKRTEVLHRLAAVGSPRICSRLLCDSDLPTAVRAAAAPTAMRDPKVLESLFTLSAELKCAAFDTFIDYPHYLFDGPFDFHPLDPPQTAALVDLFTDWFGAGFAGCLKNLQQLPYMLDQYGSTAGVYGLCAAMAVDLLTHPQLPNRSRQALIETVHQLFRHGGCDPGTIFTFDYFRTQFQIDMTFDGFMVLFETLQQLTDPFPADRFDHVREGQIDAGLFDDLSESVLRAFLEDSRFGPDLRLRLASRSERPGPHSAFPRHDLLLCTAATLLEAVQIALTAPDTFWEDPFPLKLLDPPPAAADVADALTFAADHLPAKEWLQEWLLTEAPAEALTDDAVPQLLCDTRVEQYLLPGCPHSGISTPEQRARADRVVRFLRSRLGAHLDAWRVFAALADSSTTLGFAAELAASLEPPPSSTV